MERQFGPIELQRVLGMQPRFVPTKSFSKLSIT